MNSRSLSPGSLYIYPTSLFYPGPSSAPLFFLLLPQTPDFPFFLELYTRVHGGYIFNMAKTFSKEDVASHSKPDNLWVVIDEDVYDLTQFQEEHPGGKKSTSLL